MEATAIRVGAPRKATASPITTSGLKHAAANVGLATMFFIATIPAAVQYHSGVANAIWIVGAAIMGVLSLVRFPPRSSMITVYTLAANAGMLALPGLMRPEFQSTGLLAIGGIALELSGVLLTQVARLYMGRSFGVLPANRGIVSKGPFAIVRHPIYIGWLILAIGYSMSYPSARNIILIIVTVPFMIWRIVQEESHLSADPAYRNYCSQVKFRLVPGVA
jgi:protein-S-isoprenylcysteine O-methyltransferase Ste14